MTSVTSLLETAAELSKRLSPGDLDATLSGITAAAVDLIPEVACASISIRRDDRIETVDATDDCLIALDAKQYALREGPCYDAASDRDQVVAPDLGEDPRFPHYGPFAAEAGIGAQAAFRLFERGSTLGALNLYSTRKGAFADLDQLAALFRCQAAVAVAYAYDVQNLQEALETRTTIGQAVGIVMERYQLNDERAFAFLTRLSQHRNVKLCQVAEELVAELAAKADSGRKAETS
jgi:GAF domain-containing protein